MALVLFLVCLVAAAYPLVIYPALVLALARLRPRPWLAGSVDQPVVHLITVHSEEARITRKLDNALALDPPPGGLRTVVVDDGSTDRTPEIVREYAADGVEWIGCPRGGKERAQIEAIARTTEPLLVFSDAAALLDRDAIVRIVRPFADPEIGAVSGTDRVVTEGGGTGEDLYVRYEMALRAAESRAGSLVGLSGCFFAARREVVERLVPDVPSDMGAALAALASGQRAVAEETALCSYGATSEPGLEFSRKRRTVLHGLRCLRAYPLASKPITAWQLVSHKWMRYAAPLFFLAAVTVLLVSAALGRGWALTGASALLVAAGLGLVGLVLPRARRFAPVRAVGFLAVCSAAVICAWGDLLRGRERVRWTPTRRPELH